LDELGPGRDAEARLQDEVCETIGPKATAEGAAKEDAVNLSKAAGGMSLRQASSGTLRADRGGAAALETPGRAEAARHGARRNSPKLFPRAARLPGVPPGGRDAGRGETAVVLDEEVAVTGLPPGGGGTRLKPFSASFTPCGRSSWGGVIRIPPNQGPIVTAVPVLSTTEGAAVTTSRQAKSARRTGPG